MRFTDTPQGAHLKGKKFRADLLQGETRIDYLIWQRARLRSSPSRRQRSLDNSTKRHGVLSAKKANPVEEDIDLYVLDQLVLQTGAWRRPWHGYVGLGNGGFWKSKRHAA